MARPFAVPITLTEADRAVLLGWSRRPKTAQALALRARSVLYADSGLMSTAIAAQCRITLVTVTKWRGRFAGLCHGGRDRS